MTLWIFATIAGLAAVGIVAEYHARVRPIRRWRRQYRGGRR